MRITRKEMFEIINNAVVALSDAETKKPAVAKLIEVRDGIAPRARGWKQIFLNMPTGERPTEPVRSSKLDEKIAWWKAAGIEITRIETVDAPARAPRKAKDASERKSRRPATPTPPLRVNRRRTA